jgi:AmiR/NasT family two-component response regulator
MVTKTTRCAAIAAAVLVGQLGASQTAPPPAS